ncbi:MAG TPA: hypothetical protein VLJ41_07885 [Segetibacter sp.]|nr:hypothetical protein [Segetibacter sp.]
MEEVLIGTRKTLKIQALRIDADWSQHRSIAYEYKAEPGWFILSFSPIVISKAGSVVYHFSTNRPVFQSKINSNIYSKFIELLELASEKNVSAKYDSVIIKMRNDYDSFFTKAVPMYSGITVTGFVSGNNKNSRRSKGHLYLDLQVTLVYMPGTEEQFFHSLDNLKQIINSDE